MAPSRSNAWFKYLIILLFVASISSAREVTAQEDARRDGVLAAGCDKVAEDIGLAAAPGGLLQTVRVEVALPLEEAAEMSGRENRIAAAHGLPSSSPCAP